VSNYNTNSYVQAYGRSVSTPPYILPTTLLLLGLGHSRTMTNYRALERSLVILPKISGSLSCIGSALIARHIAAKNIKEVSLASKILFGISIVDIIDSFFAYVLGSWMAPRGTLTFAVGNFTSCGVQGFVHVFGIVYLATAYTELSIVCK